jgi:hypothetical protein
MSDVRRIIFENFNDTEIRFSNDDIIGLLGAMDRYKNVELDVLDFEDVLLEMENSGLLRPIAQNFNTRYYRIRAPLQSMSCAACNDTSFYSPDVESSKSCLSCGRAML